MAYTQNNSQGRNDRIRFDLIERIGVLSRKDNGWTREVNIVSWNNGQGKVDIREWDPEHKRMTKGITLFEDEAETLTRILARRYGLIYPGNGHEQSFFDENPAGASAGEAAEAAAGQQGIAEAAPAAAAAPMPEAVAFVAEDSAQMDAAAPALS